MKIGKSLVLLVALTAASITPASVRNDIDRQYHRWAKAAPANDVETILSILAPDYTLRTFTGKTITRPEYEASLWKRKAANKPSAAYVTKIASVSPKGDTTEVISDETSETPSTDPITNKRLRLIHIHRYLDTWVRIDSVWRLRSTVTQVESTKVVPAH
jgi:ketosteroid isomerase-like protein